MSKRLGGGPASGHSLVQVIHPEMTRPSGHHRTEVAPRHLVGSGPGRFHLKGAWMAPFVYRCPSTGKQVQAWVADDPTEDDTYHAVTCLACNVVHLVNPKTGRILGTDDE
jgi:hypothetical protein